MLAAENAKYGTDYGIDMVDPTSNSVFALRPEWVFTLDSKDFTGSPTRFVSASPGQGHGTDEDEHREREVGHHEARGKVLTDREPAQHGLGHNAER